MGAGQAIYEDTKMHPPSRLQLDHDKYKKWVDEIIFYLSEMINLLGLDDLSSIVNFAYKKSLPVEVINSGPKATNQT